MSEVNITPGALAKKMRENMNKNGSLRSLFRGQLFGKFSTEELEGLKKSIDKEIAAKQQAEVDALKNQLEAMGYTVTKK